MHELICPIDRNIKEKVLFIRGGMLFKKIKKEKKKDCYNLKYNKATDTTQ